MILAFARPSVGARVGSGNVVAFGFASKGQAPVLATGFQNPITTAVHPRLLRFGFTPQGASDAVIAPTKKGGATWLSQAELRKLRKEQAAVEAKEKAGRQAIGRTIEQAYEDTVHPEIRVAREQRALALALALERQDALEAEDVAFVQFLIDNHHMLY